jgi:glycosyltransferase involved in cell wall biosynthesis
MAESKLIRIYHGARIPQNVTPENSDRIKKKLGIGNNFSIGLFGRISEFKGQHLLIEAVKRLKDEKIRVQAWIVGEAFEEAYLNQLKKMTKEFDLEDQIYYPGFYENPMELMSCLDAVVLTTKKESFGLVLIEAMHAGVPVIGSNAGGVPEIIDHGTTGLLFETWNSLSLAGAIKQLVLDEKLRKNLAINGQLKASRQFDLEKQYQKFYNTMR